MKTIYGLLLVVFFSGCGYSTSQRRVVSSPAGVRMSESRNCVGMDCGDGYGYDAGYGQWAMGSASYQGLAPSWGRFGAIEAYRAQNRWVRGPVGGVSGEARDSRLDMLVPHLRNMTSAMCRSGALTGDDCVPPERLAQPANQAPGTASTGEPSTPPAPVTGSATGSAASQGATEPPHGELRDEPHQRRPSITADELE